MQVFNEVIGQGLSGQVGPLCHRRPSFGRKSDRPIWPLQHHASPGLVFSEGVAFFITAAFRLGTKRTEKRLPLRVSR